MAQDPKNAKKKNVHRDHRERMRRRFFSSGAEGFADHELLEMLLYYAIPRRNTNEQAHELLDTFGSFEKIFETDADTLSQIGGIGESTAIYLTLLSAAIARYEVRKSEAENPVEVVDYANVDRFLINYYTARHTEAALLLTFNAQNQLNGKFEFSSSANDYAIVDIQAMIRYAAIHNATSVLCAHNHPDGIAIPSGEDYELTKRMMRAFNAAGFLFRGHVIVAGKNLHRIETDDFSYQLF